MKRLLLTITILLGMVLTVQSQNWKFTISGSSIDITNTVQNKLVFDSTQILLEFDVENLTAGTLGAYISRKKIVIPSDGWYEQVCFGSAASGGFCTYPDTTLFLWTSDNPISIDPDSIGEAQVKITPNPLEAPAVYRYYIGVQGDLFQDSVDISITSSLSVEEVEKEMNLSVSPNPASDYVKIKVSNFEKGNLKVVDVLGNEIKKLLSMEARN